MPEDEEVLYPPIQVSAERLRRLTPQRGWKSASKRSVTRKRPATRRKTINDGRYRPLGFIPRAYAIPITVSAA